VPSRRRIAVVAGQFEDIVSRGLRSLLEDDPNLHLVATGVADERMSAALSVYKPNVAILNFGSLRDGAELRNLHERFPDTHLLVLANRPTLAEVRQLLAMGATGCLPKSAQERDFLNAIHLASRGLQILPPAATPSDRQFGLEPLTSRESDVLALLQDGRSNTEIAATLQIGVETVRTHARHVYKKLGVRTRRDLRARR
jgi:DNA-binding NarL/FixJ family response regulator